MAKKNNCEKYGLAITNYVLGEKMPMPKEELFDHLKTCAKCRADLADWENNYAVLQARQSDSKPEVRKQWEEFLKNLGQPAPGVTTQLNTHQPVDIDAKWVFGSPSGVIYNYLAKQPDKRAPTNNILKDTNLGPVKTTLGMAWLVCQDKLRMNRVENTTYAYLHEPR
jgi:hypothetical protein